MKMTNTWSYIVVKYRMTWHVSNKIRCTESYKIITSN